MILVGQPKYSMQTRYLLCCYTRNYRKEHLLYKYYLGSVNRVDSFHNNLLRSLLESSLYNKQDKGRQNHELRIERNTYVIEFTITKYIVMNIQSFIFLYSYQLVHIYRTHLLSYMVKTSYEIYHFIGTSTCYHPFPSISLQTFSWIK